MFGIIFAGTAIVILFAVFLTALMIQLNKKRYEIPISAIIRVRLFIIMLVAFLITQLFTFVVQSISVAKNIENMMTRSLNDVQEDITTASDQNLLSLTQAITDRIIAGDDYSTETFLRFCKEYDVAEISFIDKNGIIAYSSNEEFLGFDMRTGDQSTAFMVLLDSDGPRSLVQPYMPISYDQSTSRKYAGLTVPGFGFSQVGYDADQFQADINQRIAIAANHRHIGDDGYMIIVDEDNKVVSSSFPTTKYSNGKQLSVYSTDYDEYEENKAYKIQIGSNYFYQMYQFKEGYNILALYPEEEAVKTIKLVALVTAIIEILLFIILYFTVIVLLNRVVTGNIEKVTKSLTKITDGDLDEVVEVYESREFTSLSTDINQTVDSLKNYIAEASNRINKELDYAKAIQKSSLPSKARRYENRQEFELHAAMYPAKEVGGDFYDFYQTDPEHLVFTIADVSGKGIPAAMFMMKAMTIIRNIALTNPGVDEVLRRANNALCEGNDSNMFVTVWIGCLNISNGTLEYASGGHNPPLLYRDGGDFEYIEAKANMVLAGMENVKYQKHEMKLYPGDMIFLYTDGVTEATDAHSELYGEQRLANILNSMYTKEKSVETLLSDVKADVDMFVDEAPQFDDITMLGIKFINPEAMGGAFAVKEYQLQYPASLDKLESLTDFISTQMEKIDAPIKAINQVLIASEEIYVNIAHYAYKDKEGNADITVKLDTNVISITFEDSGIPFNPLEKEDPDVTLTLEDREVGGLGIFMVKKIMDDVTYEYKDNKNVLTITKHWNTFN